jgi:copper homeostasis protein
MAFIEICAANIQSALAADAGGAHRIELCAGLETGGLTPSAGLVRAAVSQLSIPVCVLIRVREGNFHYNHTELAIMLDDIRFCREAGAAGVVVGALTDTFELDMPALAAMKEAAGSMELVHHRAFDFVKNPEKALTQLIDLGFHRVLSSGQKNQAWEGREALAEWIRTFGHQIQIMPGSGVRLDNLAALKAVTQAAHFHLTAKKWVEQAVSNDIPGLPAGYFESELETIRACVAAVNG